jgi:hypothetical protein
MASKTNRVAANKAIWGAMNRTENKLAEKFFSNHIRDEKTSSVALKNKVEDKKMTSDKHSRQKH